MRFVEAIRIDKNHLQEAVGQELHRKAEEVSDRAEYLPAFARRFVQRHQAHTLLEIRASQEIFVTGWHLPQVLVRLQVLNVGFHERGVVAHLRKQPLLVADHTIDHLVRRARLIGRRSGRGDRRHNSASAKREHEDFHRQLSHDHLSLSRPAGTQSVRGPDNPRVHFDASRV